MKSIGYLVVLFAGLSSAYAEEEAPGKRWELTFNVYDWSSLAGLTPAAGGSFDSVGIGLAGAIHWPVLKLGDSELLLGFDAGFMTSDSSIPGFRTELSTAHGFVAPSIKWLFGDKHRFSLDAGVGWHLIDISEIDYAYSYYYYQPGFEAQYWSESAVAPYVGATWDVGAGVPGKIAAFSIGLKVHYLDFGTVRDEDPYLPVTLGSDAGDLSGPMLALQLGAAFR